MEITALSILGYVLLGVAVIYWLYTLCLNFIWARKPLQNFPFKWRGKNYWYSRSCAVVLFTFCKDKNGLYYILANKRGSGTPDFQGCWNAPCGYLDYGEDAKQAAQRETKEECGITVPYEKIKLVETASSPTQNRQNVTLRHIAILDGTIDDYKFSTEGMEKNEVDDVKWIRTSGEELLSHQWAFDHGTLIRHMCELIENNENIIDSTAI